MVLSIAGDGDLKYVHTLKSLVRDLAIGDHVKWLGYVEGERKADILAAASVFVLPSYSENFGIAVVEALAVGLPCTVWHNHGIDETPEALVIGEYGIVVEGGWAGQFWRSVAYLYVTRDEGRSWLRIEYFVRNGASKHIHLVRYSPLLKRLIITVGDKRKQSYWTNSVDSLRPEVLKKGLFGCFSWGGGHTAFAETGNEVLLGTDYHGGTNSIIVLRSGTDSRARMLPEPYRHSPVLNMHAISYERKSVVFAWLHSELRETWKSALIYSDDGGISWSRLFEYDARCLNISIVNSQPTISPSLVVVFENRNSGERRTIIMSIAK